MALPLPKCIYNMEVYKKVTGLCTAVTASDLKDLKDKTAYSKNKVHML